MSSQSTNNKHIKNRKRLRDEHDTITNDTNPNKRRKLNSNSNDNINSNSTEEEEEEKENEIIFSVKVKVDGKDKTFDCYKQKKGICLICYVPNSKLVTISPKCKHTAKYCLHCIQKSIGMNITEKGLGQFKCDDIECSTKYEAVSIFPLLNKRNLEIVDKLLLHKALENNVEFRWCKSMRGCGYGQLVENWQDLRGYYSCNACGEYMCFQHEIKWHTGFTCNEYEKELKANPLIATNAVLMSFTKRCPNCFNSIGKLEGCDVMTCCQYGTHGCCTNKKRFNQCDHGGKPFCGQLFCWKCLGKIKVNKGGGYQRNCKPHCQYFSLNN